MEIVFLTATTFIYQSRRDLFIDSIEQKYKVHLWSMNIIYDLNYELCDELSNVHHLSSIQELETKFGEIKGKKIIITDLSLKHLSKVYKIIKRNKIDIIYISKNDFQNYITNKSKLIYENLNIVQKLKIILKKSSLIEKIINTKKYGFSCYDYFLSEYNYYPISTKKYIKIHHVKYDEYLGELSKRPIISKKYAVFLDSYIPFHPDILEHDSSQSVEPIKYFKLLNDFFDFIEKKYDVEVVISSHPKAEYTDEIFNGRKIIKYNTPNLIQYSEFVIAHATTSIINVVLASKPIVFIFYDEMLRKGTRRWTISTIEYSKMLEASLVNIEETFKFNLNINSYIYNKFKYDYIVNRKAEDVGNKKIIIDFLTQYFT